MKLGFRVYGVTEKVKVTFALADALSAAEGTVDRAAVPVEKFAVNELVRVTVPLAGVQLSITTTPLAFE
jgi:hypothetical protein